MIVKNLAIAQDLAAQEISKKQHNMKDSHDKNAGQPNFTIGQKVLLHDPRKRKGLSRKLAPHYLGPCTIIDQKSPVLFQITGLPDNRMHDVVHVDRLKPFHENHKLSLRNDTNGHDKSSPPPLSDRDPKLTEDTQLTDQQAALNPSSAASDHAPPTLTILDHRRRRQKMEYLCQKQGDPLAAAQWLPTSKINNNKLISDYLQQRQDRPFTRS